MAITERILQVIDKKNITKYKFCQDLGLSKGFLDKPREITTDKYANILVYFPDISPEWLLTGKGSMLKQDLNRLLEDKQEQISVYKLKTDYYGVEKQNIPLFEINARAGLDVLFSSQATQVPIDFISVPNAPKCDGALFVRGDSMYPILKAGDIVCYKAVNSIDNLILGEMYILDIDNGEEEYLTVKFVKKSDLGDDFVTLVSENQHHANRDILRSSIRALGLVKLSIRYNTIS